jgi:hypothetical protein
MEFPFHHLERDNKGFFLSSKENVEFHDIYLQGATGASRLCPSGCPVSPERAVLKFLGTFTIYGKSNISQIYHKRRKRYGKDQKTIYSNYCFMPRCCCDSYRVVHFRSLRFIRGLQLEDADNADTCSDWFGDHVA